MENKDYLKHYDEFADTIPSPDVVFSGSESGEAEASSDEPGNFPEGHFLAPKPELNRRAFLAAMGGGLATAASIAVVPAVVEHGEEIVGQTIGRERAEAELSEVRERLRNIYGVEVDFSPIQDFEDKEVGHIHGEAPAFLVGERKVCEALERVLMTYPPMMYRKRATLSRVRVVDNLLNENHKAALGLAEKETGDMYLCSTKFHINGKTQKLELVLRSFLGAGGNKERELRATIHHEFAHMMDAISEAKWDHDARNIDIDAKLTTDDLPRLYTTEIDALVGRSLLRSGDAAQLKENYTGFASPYGKTMGAEDRASLIEYLYRYPETIAARIMTDPDLARKVEFMKKEYFMMSRGVMNDAYWDIVREHPDNPKFPAEYIKLQSAFLTRLTLAQYKDYISAKGGKALSDDEAEMWKVEIAQEAR